MRDVDVPESIVTARPSHPWGRRRGAAPLLLLPLVLCGSAGAALARTRAANPTAAAAAQPARAKPATAQPAPAQPTPAQPTAARVESAKVLVLPVIVRVPVQASGKFSGLGAGALVERFHRASHARFVAAFVEAAGAESRILPATQATRLLEERELGPAQTREPEAMKGLAQAAQVLWVVRLELDKEGSLHARVFGDDGAEFGAEKQQPKARSLSVGVARAAATAIWADLGPALGLEALPGAVAPPLVPFDPSSDPGSVAAEAEGTGEGASAAALAAEAPRPPSRARPRGSLLVASGASLRALAIAGPGSEGLARLETGTVAFTGATARIAPLQLFAATADGRWTDVELELRYRRGLARGEVTAGPTAGQPCSVSDDELGARVAWRAKLGEGRWPWLGAAVGWSAQQTRLRCPAPVPSTEWRGVDVQLRYQQPLVGDLLAFDLSAGPHFGMSGQGNPSAPLSFTGEAWIELKPVSLLYVRAGARVAAYRATLNGLSVRDSRTIASVEAGVFF